jgi:hypothetical protein
MSALGSEFWTVVGSSAGVVAVILAAVQVWQARRQRTRRTAYAVTEAAPLFEDNSAPSPGTIAPPFGRLVSHIVGRSDILSDLEHIVAEPDGSAHVLCGLGGIGKSTVALEIARRCREQDHTIWWLSCPSADAVTSSMLTIGTEYLGLSENERDEAAKGVRNAADLVWRRLESTSNWVLIFDNVDDPEILSYGNARAKDGAGWLRAARRGLVVVTSRLTEPDSWGLRVQIHEIRPLSSDEGGDLLLHLAPNAGTLAAAQELSRRLANFPLALYQAGRHISSPFVREKTFNAYREALVTDFAVLLGSKVELPGEDEMRSRVAATWELSIRQLERNGYEGSREMLELLSCYSAPVPIPAEIITGLRFRPPTVVAHLRTRVIVGPGRPYSSSQAIEAQLKSLRSVGLINIEELGSSDGRRFAVVLHPLVAETVWRYVHQGPLGGLKYRRHRRHVARRASGGVAAASVMIDRRDDWEYRARVWNFMYSHLTRLLLVEADYLPKRELAELILAANRGVVRTFSEALTGRYSIDRGWDLVHLMEARALPWGTSWYWASVNLRFSNLDRFSYLDGLLSNPWYSD